jgi:prevent-host-death family protein
MQTVNIHEAKTHLSMLVERCAAGEEIIIAKANRPMVKLVALEPQPVKRKLGFIKGKVPVSFFDPLPEEYLQEWEK